MGGAGRGSGGVAGEEPHEVDFDPSQVKGRLGPGKVLVTGYRNGLPEKGDAKRQYAELVAENKDAFDAPVENERIPRDDREAVLRYFDSVKVKESAPGDKVADPDAKKE